MPPLANGDFKLTGVVRSSLANQHPAGGGLLQPGQVVRARVEQVAGDGAVLLRVGHQSFKVVTDLNLGRGQELLIRMTASGAHPSFSILRVLPAQGRERQIDPQAGSRGDYLGPAVQSLVSRQQPLSALLGWLSAGANAELEAGALAQWAALRRLLTSPRDLVQPSVLRSSIEDSGLLLEPRLRAALLNPQSLPAAVAGDLKLILWRLMGGANSPVDPQLLQLLEGVAAQISLRQLHAINQAERGHFHWSVELPLSWAGQMVPVALTIRREHGLAGGDAQADDSWQVEFSLEIEPLGALRVAMYLRNQRVSVALEAERQAAVEQLADGLSQLEEALQLQGFSVETLLSRPVGDEAPDLATGEFSSVLAVQV